MECLERRRIVGRSVIDIVVGMRLRVVAPVRTIVWRRFLTLRSLAPIYLHV